MAEHPFPGTKLLEGIVEPAGYEDRRVVEMEAEIAELTDQVRQVTAERDQARRAGTQAVAALRRQLSPLYQALHAVFGELDRIVDDAPGGAGSTATSPAVDARTAAIYQSWKSRLAPQCGKIIDALLIQPGMTQSQLAIAIGTRRQNIPSLIFKLNQAGLISKTGNRYALKSL